MHNTQQDVNSASNTGISSFVLSESIISGNTSGQINKV